MAEGAVVLYIETRKTGQFVELYLLSPMLDDASLFGYRGSGRGRNHVKAKFQL